MLESKLDGTATMSGKHRTTLHPAFDQEWPTYSDFGGDGSPKPDCSRHHAMKELDDWICGQHPEDSHTLMLYADRMNQALQYIDANGEADA